MRGPVGGATTICLGSEGSDAQVADAVTMRGPVGSAAGTVSQKG